MPLLTLAPTYVPLVQRPKCCAPVCMAMISYRNDRTLLNQEDVAVQLGVRVFKKDLKAFTVRLPRMHQYNRDEGISTLNSVDKIRGIFRDHDVRLRLRPFRYRTIRTIERFERLIIKALSGNNDVWVEYHSQPVHPYDSLKRAIHDGLIESYDTEKKIAVITDSVIRRPQRKEVSLEALWEAIGPKHGKELGVVVVSKPRAAKAA